MSDVEKHFEDLVEALKRERDELKVQIHLGKAEAKEEWERLDAKWDELAAQREEMKAAATETAKEVGSALEMAAA